MVHKIGTICKDFQSATVSLRTTCNVLCLFQRQTCRGEKKENTFNKASIELTIKRGPWGLALSFTVQTFAVATHQLNYKYF